MERLGITMLINDKSQLKRNVKQIGFQLALKTSKSLVWSDRLRQTVPYCPYWRQQRRLSLQT